MPWSESSSNIGTKAAEAATWRWDVENGRAGDASGLDHLGLFLYTRVFHCNQIAEEEERQSRKGKTAGFGCRAPCVREEETRRPSGGGRETRPPEPLEPK